MSRNIIHTVVLAALATLATSALADPPAIVGRISSVQGQVTLVGDDEPVPAALNWPVTSANHISTATGSRTEFRVGSTAVRVDGDSDLEVVDMDDDLLHLRLNYGSVSIRVRNPDVLRDFELSTPQARITMVEPGILRVDTERIADTSQISVLAGSARVDGAGSSVTVANGRHVDVSSEDVRTSVARRDGFDVWAEDRDRADQSAGPSVQFVSSGMTGYEELDRNGSWAENVEYGALWTPRNVAADWAPYRDGRWIWLSPWGWTWVDNASWGYAPSHYGRWVMVGNRWSWAPGRPAGRPVWAPALVGWVGGDSFSNNHRGPGVGWFPLSPRERFVPTYRVSPEQERRLVWAHNGKPLEQRPVNIDHHAGMTVLPREQFEGRHHTVAVTRGPQVIPAPNLGRNVTAAAPPQPAYAPRVLETSRRGLEDRDHDGRPDRFERPGNPPGRVLTAPSQPVPVQGPAQQMQNHPQQTTTLAPGQFGTPNAAPQTVRPGDVRVDVRPRLTPGQPPSVGAASGGAPNAAQNGVQNAAPAVQVQPVQDGRQDRFDRRNSDDGRRLRQQQDQQQPQQQAQQQEQQRQQEQQQQRQQQEQRRQQEQQQRQQRVQQADQAQPGQQRQQQAQPQPAAQPQQPQQPQQAQQPQRSAPPAQQPVQHEQGHGEQHKEGEKRKDDPRDNKNQNRQ